MSWNNNRSPGPGEPRWSNEPAPWRQQGQQRPPSPGFSRGPVSPPAPERAVSRNNGRVVPSRVEANRPSAPASATMTNDVQRKFLYLFERVNEPLYLGARGTERVYYDCPTDMMSEVEKKASAMIRDEVPSKASTIVVPRPAAMPDLEKIAAACPRSKIFSYFLPPHREAAGELTNILMNPGDIDQFLATSVVCRDSPKVNTQLWVHAMYSAALSRPDTRGIRLPPLWEVMPDLFIDGLGRKVAQQQAALPGETRALIQMNQVKEQVGTGAMTQEVTLDSSFSGRSDNPENKLWYFREDIGVASHHWHWHIIYSGNNPPGRRDRKGELFYYMHHSMIARYEAERLCNGLARTRPLDIAAGPVIEEGFFSKLSSENAGSNWGTRQDFTQLRDVFRQDDNVAVDIEDIRKWKDRILEAIDSGFVVDREGKRIRLNEKEGIDILGGLIENGGMSSLNAPFYGNLHNMGHVLIAASHDPEHRHKEALGPMGAEATAIRDPAFFRWHKFIDNLFDKFKQTLDPYPDSELAWNQVEVQGIKVNTAGVPDNILTSQWGQTDVDLARGLDLARSQMGKNQVWARFTHLDHLPFTYTISVKVNASAPVPGTIRIFMAPRYNEHGQRFPMTQQRLLFFEMDKFSHTFHPGSNTLTRKSEDSSVTIPWEQSFRDLENLLQSEAGTITSAVCGCGWPHHLLLPKGTADGIVFDLFVMVSDGEKDRVVRENPVSEGQRQQCKESVSFCGLLNEKYPDARPMGYPFDRRPQPQTGGGGSRNGPNPMLESFVSKFSNMRAIEVKVIHQNKVTVRPGGADLPSYSVVKPENATSKNRRRGQNVQGRDTNNGRRSRADDYDGGRVMYNGDSSPDRFYD